MKTFPVVCVGGSAGGLDAYIRLLQNLPADMGVAIVIVNHITLMPTQLHDSNGACSRWPAPKPGFREDWLEFKLSVTVKKGRNQNGEYHRYS